MDVVPYKKSKYFPIHELHQDLPKSQIESILAFHAITGCDSVSFIAGHSKKSAWKVFGTHYELLCDLGKSNQIKSNQIKSNQIKSNQIKSNQIKSNQIKSNQIKSNQIKIKIKIIYFTFLTKLHELKLKFIGFT